MLVENLEKPKVFLEFHNKFQKKFQKNLGLFFWNSSKFLKKKNLGFSKIPKFQNSKNIWWDWWIFWNFGKLNVFLEFWRIPKIPLVFLEFDPKTFKKPRYFWNFIVNPKKTLGFFEFFKIPKNPWVFQNSKILKTMLISHNVFGILENSRFWCNFYCGRMAVYLDSEHSKPFALMGFWTQHAITTLRMTDRRK